MTAQKSIKAIVSVFLFILLVILASEGLSALSKIKATGKNHALIIGINNYKNWTKLQSPASDAEAIADVLAQKYNFRRSNITLLTDNTEEKPTLINILTSLGKYIDELTEKDNLFIFFSGQSAEDEKGETYWIPRDGKKKSKFTWLKHSALIEEFFTSENFKAKNLLIITDTPFKRKLIRRYENPVTLDNLRYEEKILEAASRSSREVIAFGDQHWPGSKNTNGMGLFAYYIHKLLLENDFEIIDFENLIFLFDDDVPFTIAKIAGTKLLAGRLRTASAQKGQFVLARLAPSPVVDIVDTVVTPGKGYPGDKFTVAAKTNGAASEVYLEINGQKHFMQGAGTEWQYSLKIDKLGKTPFVVAAINPNDIEGKPRKGRILTIKPRAPVVNVKQVSIDPRKGLGGDKFRFTATTETPAAAVALIVKGKRFKMSGSGTNWSLAQKIDHIGSVNFSAVSTNIDGIEGRSKEGTILLEAGISNVIAVKPKPETGYAGEEFMISVKTDRIAAGVALKMDGKVYPMEGSGSSWHYKKLIPDIGTKQFTVIAKNIKGQTGRALSGKIVTKKSPLPIPDIAAVDVSVVSPGKGYAGDSFAIKVNTSAPSDKVYVDIDGQQFAMKGTGTQWNYVARIDKLGLSKYSVIARNKDGVQGQPKAGEIKTTKEPALPVNVITAEVSPKTGDLQKRFTFSAKTDRPAKSVSIMIGKKRYGMTGKGTEWKLSKKLDQTGTIDFSVIARNEDNAEGGFKTAAVKVVKQRFKKNADGTLTDNLTGKTRNRFVDNKDGTVTDLLTSIMWMQKPKQVALTYKNAVVYARNLKYKGLSGWRLPTISELKKISDKKQQNPALPLNNPFTGVLTHLSYWSKTKHKFGPKYVYKMNMWFGRV
ncbi:MAG: DUF1566 domain-containing protein, partial [Candidatus Desulfatibia sp.]|uniref:Lcl domain-containing protein n=1 Tax=Candidatus Desulfatibia sp. TaxID=3101189 RepID=UPI002F2EA7CE